MINATRPIPDTIPLAPSAMFEALIKPTIIKKDINIFKIYIFRKKSKKLIPVKLALYS